MLGLFRRRQSVAMRPTRARLPAETARRIETFGRFSFAPQGSSIDIDFGTYYAPFLPLVQTDPRGFVDELAAIVWPVGGWAMWGGAYYVTDVDAPTDQESDLQMLDASIDVVIAQGYDPALHLNGYRSGSAVASRAEPAHHRLGGRSLPQITSRSQPTSAGSAPPAPT